MAPDRGRPLDVLDGLVGEHREVERLLDHLRRVEDEVERRRVADLVTAHLVRHWLIEETYVYPTASSYLVDGEELVTHHRAEHAHLEVMLKELEPLDGGDERFTALVLDLQSDLADHIADEEDQLFAKLRFAVPADELVGLMERVELSTLITPATRGRRPHEILLESVRAGAGLVDRLRATLGRPPSP